MPCSQYSPAAVTGDRIIVVDHLSAAAGDDTQTADRAHAAALKTGSKVFDL
jgi:hypothetical protein